MLLHGLCVLSCQILHIKYLVWLVLWEYLSYEEHYCESGLWQIAYLKMVIVIYLWLLP